MATTYVLGRVVGTPLVGNLSDVLLKKFAVPRSVIISSGCWELPHAFGLIPCQFPMYTCWGCCLLPAVY